MQNIYIISGPLGVGKSTISKELSKHIRKSALIHGDNLLHIYSEDASPPWDEKLAIMWKNILAVTNNLIQHDFNVIIDIVVEDELEWFCRHFAHLNIKVKYIVLRADMDVLIERLKKRGDAYLIDRSVLLLKKLETDTPFNKRYLYDTTHKEPAEILKDILDLPNFDLEW